MKQLEDFQINVTSYEQRDYVFSLLHKLGLVQEDEELWEDVEMCAVLATFDSGVYDAYFWQEDTQPNYYAKEISIQELEEIVAKHEESKVISEAVEESYGSIPRRIHEGWEEACAEIVEQEKENLSATGFLKQAAALQESRANEYDQEGGERSAGKIATAFNAITGHNLSESDVWMLLVVLKQVRFYNNPANKHRDSVEDLVSYSALFAESVFKENVE